MKKEIFKKVFESNTERLYNHLLIQAESDAAKYEKSGLTEDEIRQEAAELFKKHLAIYLGQIL